MTGGPSIPSYIGRVSHDGVVYGTCFQVTPDGLAITAFHVLRDAGCTAQGSLVNVESLSGAVATEATVLDAQSPTTDLALLRLDSPLSPDVPRLTPSDHLPADAFGTVQGYVGNEPGYGPARYDSARVLVHGPTMTEAGVQQVTGSGDNVSRGMSGGPLILPDGSVGGMLKSRFTAGRTPATRHRDTVWIARCEDIAALAPSIDIGAPHGTPELQTGRVGRFFIVVPSDEPCGAVLGDAISDGLAPHEVVLASSAAPEALIEELAKADGVMLVLSHKYEPLVSDGSASVAELALDYALKEELPITVYLDRDYYRSLIGSTETPDSQRRAQELIHRAGELQPRHVRLGDHIGIVSAMRSEADEIVSGAPHTQSGYGHHDVTPVVWSLFTRQQLEAAGFGVLVVELYCFNMQAYPALRHKHKLPRLCEAIASSGARARFFHDGAGTPSAEQFDLVVCIVTGQTNLELLPEVEALGGNTVLFHEAGVAMPGTTAACYPFETRELRECDLSGRVLDIVKERAAMHVAGSSGS